MITMTELIKRGISLFVFKPHWNNKAFAMIFGESNGVFCDCYVSYGESISTGECKSLYYPYGEGDTYEEALDQALSKLSWMSLDDAVAWIIEEQTKL